MWLVARPFQDLSLGSLTDFSVDTASECDKVRAGRCTPPPAVASGADWGEPVPTFSGKGPIVHRRCTPPPAAASGADWGGAGTDLS